MYTIFLNDLNEKLKKLNLYKINDYF